MTVLFNVDWDSGTLASTTYTLAPPEVPNGHTLTTGASSVYSEAASPWSGQWVAEPSFATPWKITSTVSASTIQATSGRLLIQMNPTTSSGANINLFDARDSVTGDRLNLYMRNSDTHLVAHTERNGGAAFADIDLGAYPAVAHNVELIYDFNNATANQRARARVWNIGGSAGSFTDATSTSGSAGTTAQFNSLTMGDENNGSTALKIGKIFFSDSITEDLSALLSGATAPKRMMMIGVG